MNPDRDESNEAKAQHGDASDEICHVTSSKCRPAFIKAIISAELPVTALREIYDRPPD
jgi:hypothetical protein